MSLLVGLIIALIIVAAAVWVVRLIPIPAEMAWVKTIILIVIGLIFIFWLLGLLGVVDYGHFQTFRGWRSDR